MKTNQNPPTIEKKCWPIGSYNPSNREEIWEVARDSWPKLVPDTTKAIGKSPDGAIVYRGKADPEIYDEDDFEKMRASDTVAVVDAK